MNENDYDASRAEALLERRGLTRRDLVKLGARLCRLRSGSPGSPRRQRSPARPRAENGSPIAKKLPPEWFVNFGTNAEMRWDAVAGLGYTTPNERFFVRDHTGTPIIDPATLVAPRLRHGPEGIAGLVHLRATPGAAAEGDRVVHRVRRQRPLLLRLTAGHARGGHAVGTRRDRSRPLARRPPLRDPRARRDHRRRSRRDAVRTRRQRRHGRHRLRQRPAPIPVAKALDNALVALEMNGQPLPADHGFPARLIVPGWIGVANVKWIGQIEVSRQPLFSLWNTQQYVMTGPSYPTTPLLTTQVVKSAWELARGATFTAGRAAAALRPSLVGRGRDQPRRCQRRPRRHLDRRKLLNRSGPGNWSRFTYPLPNLPAGNYQLWARATDNHYASSPRSHRSTPPATSSAPSSATRSPSASDCS